MFGLPFLLIPVPTDEAGKTAAFARIREQVDAHAPDAIVPARSSTRT
jgi:formyltetrahydrofolate deformylase